MPSSNAVCARSSSTAISESRRQRRAASKPTSSGRQRARVFESATPAQITFQLVYVLKGWIEFEYEGHGVVRLEADSCVHQPPEIRHREVGHSEDIEMLEIVLPAGFATEEVTSVNGERT